MEIAIFVLSGIVIVAVGLYFFLSPKIDIDTPDPDPETGRSEFGLHRDSNVTIYPGSAGCIVVKTSDFNDKIRPFLDGLRETQSFISLSVVYST
jgi:hypothetical protein